MSSDFRLALRAAAERVFDDWFSPMWANHRWEIEVHADRRLRGRNLEEGLSLSAPFGLGGAQTNWWFPGRRRQLPLGQWHVLCDVAEVEAAVRRVIEEAAPDPDSASTR